MPTYGSTPEGFVAKPQTVIEAEMRARILANIHPNLNLNSDSLLGQYLGVTSAQLRQIWEALQDLYASMDPDQADGDALARIGKLSLAYRLTPQPSTVYMTIILEGEGGGTTYDAGELRVHVEGDATKAFANREAITVTSTQTLTGVPFDALVNGPTVANPNTVNQITVPRAGFSLPEVDPQPEAADLGRYLETDTEFRKRRLALLSQDSNSSAAGLRNAILAVSGVDFCMVLENATGSTSGEGIPAWSIWPIVQGGDSAEIAAAIFATKALGGATYGDVNETGTDEAGNAYTINFSRPTAVPCKMRTSYTWLTTAFANEAAAEAAVEEAILAAVARLQNVGKDVILAKYVAAIIAVPGIIDVALEAALVGDSLATSNLVMEAYEQATFDPADLAYIAYSADTDE